MLFEVQKLPSFYFRFGRAVSCVQAEIHAFKVYRTLSWIFPLPVWSHSILMRPNGKLDPENIGIAVGISLISCLGAEIHAFEVWRPPSWIFPLPVWSHSIRISSSGMLDLKNVGFAVGISIILYLGRHLGFFHFRLSHTISVSIPMDR